MIFLRDWSVGNLLESPFAAPEQGVFALQGIVFGHPNFVDGASITTSEIKEVKGKIVKTHSGSSYLLEGPPDNEFLDFLKEKGVIFDENNPLNFKR